MKLLRTVVTMCLLLASVWSWAGNLSPEQAAKFLEESGLRQALNGMPALIQQQYQRSRAGMGESTADVLGRALQNVTPDQISLDYLATIPAARLQPAIDFLDSPLGQKISEEERKNSTAEAQLAIPEYLQALAENPPGEFRSQQIHKLIEAINAPAVMTQIVKNSMYSVASLAELGVEQNKMKLMIDQEWPKMEPVIMKQMQDNMIIAAYFTYRDITDKALESYVSFLRSEGGQVYSQIAFEIIDLYFNEVMQQFAQVTRQANP